MVNAKRVGVGLVLAAMAAVAVWMVAGKREIPGTVTVRDGGRVWRFLPVPEEGVLPLAFMRSGDEEKRGEMTPVTLPRFWIAERMVTEGEFAEMMGREVREGRRPDQIADEIEPAEALAYCRAFTERYRERLPQGVVASMPTMYEWVHAARALRDRVAFAGEGMTFLFTSNGKGGFLRTLMKRSGPGPFDPSCDLALIGKRMRQPKLGLRMVLINLEGDGVMRVAGEPYGNIIAGRGQTLMQNGFVEEGRAYLESVLAKGRLPEKARKAAEDALAFAKREREVDLEDWSGLVARSAAFAQKAGYETSPYAEHWQWLGIYPDMEKPEVAAAYAKAGISGKLVRIGDLPREVREGQIVGEKRSDDEEPISDETLVQVLACDFTGHGRKDLVVEEYGCEGGDGALYGFYGQQADGSYTNLWEIQVVGLCALPRRDGCACGFLVIEKGDGQTLWVSLAYFKDSEPEVEEANPKPFAMLDVDEKEVYRPVPYIGPVYGWSYLQFVGVWYRPLFWPWKQGKEERKVKNDK
ncbi:MAG: hypothetical protein J6334_01440 [Kiritimatiellae bacterium]|nr:hypothetical protein [Kiritimatiellia bacterium]